MAFFSASKSTWRIGMAGALVGGSLKNSGFNLGLNEGGWNLVLFGGLVLAIFSGLMTKANPLVSRVKAILVLVTVLVGWANLSITWTPPPASQNGSLLLLLLPPFLWACARRWQEWENIEKDLTVVVYILFALHLPGVVLGVLGNPDVLLDDETRFRGLTVNPNYTALQACIGLTLVLWLAQSKRLRGAPAIVIALTFATSILWTGTRGAVLAVVVAIAVYVLTVMSVRSRLAVLYVTVCLGALGWTARIPQGLDVDQFLREDNSTGFTSGRASLWRIQLHQWFDHPFLGIGHNQSKFEVGTGGLNAHNLFLQEAVELGLIGLLTIATIAVISVRTPPLRPRHGIITLVAPLLIFIYELTEASILGLGNPTAVLSWTVLAAAWAGYSARDNTCDLPSQSALPLTMASNTSKNNLPRYRCNSHLVTK